MHKAKAYDEAMKLSIMLPDDIVPYQNKQDVDIKWAQEKFDDYAAPVLKIGKNVISQDKAKYLFQLKERLGSVRSTVINATRTVIRENLKKVLHSEGIKGGNIDDYQLFLNDVFKAPFEEHGQVLHDGSRKKVTLEDAKTLYFYIKLRDAIDLRCLRDSAYKVLLDSYGY